MFQNWVAPRKQLFGGKSWDPTRLGTRPLPAEELEAPALPQSASSHWKPGVRWWRDAVATRQSLPTIYFLTASPEPHLFRTRYSLPQGGCRQRAQALELAYWARLILSLAVALRTHGILSTKGSTSVEWIRAELGRWWEALLGAWTPEVALLSQSYPLRPSVNRLEERGFTVKARFPGTKKSQGVESLLQFSLTDKICSDSCCFYLSLKLVLLLFGF